MVAAFQHVGHEAARNVEIVVEVGEQTFRRRIRRFECEHAARRIKVEFARVVDDVRLRAETREYRHLARKRCAQRVYGLHAQARSDVRNPFRRKHGRQPLQNPPLHFCRGLARKGNGENFLRPFDGGEQP